MAKSSAKRRATTPPARGAGMPAESSTRISVPPRAKTAGRSAPVAPRRRFRGAAPWAARHAAKHAAEAEARNKEPPRPGSARATLRAPEEAERIKARIGELHEAVGLIRVLKKQLAERFYEAGVVLKRIRDQRLFDAKGYASFEAFVEREIDLGSKMLALRLARIPEVFLEAAARSSGLDALVAALEAMEQAAQRAQRAGPGLPPSRGR